MKIKSATRSLLKVKKNQKWLVVAILSLSLATSTNRITCSQPTWREDAPDQPTEEENLNRELWEFAKKLRILAQ